MENMGLKAISGQLGVNSIYLYTSGGGTKFVERGYLCVCCAISYNPLVQASGEASSSMRLVRPTLRWSLIVGVMPLPPKLPALVILVRW